MSSDNNTKVCKHCKTEIPKKAKVCPQCRKKQGGIMKWILLVFLAFILIGALAGGASEETSDSSDHGTAVTENQQAETDADVAEEIVVEYTAVTVDEMIDILDSNAMKAEAAYQDAYVEITGRLDTIDSDGKYITLMPANDEWAFIGVTCYMKNEEQKTQVMEMSVGDTVTLRGKIKDVGEVVGYYLDIDSIN